MNVTEEKKSQMQPKVGKPTEEESQTDRLLGPDVESDDKQWRAMNK